MAYYTLKLGNSEFEHGKASHDKTGIVKSIFSTTNNATVSGTQNYNDSPVIQQRSNVPDRFYGVEVDSDGKMYVNVPWVGSTKTKLSQFENDVPFLVTNGVGDIEVNKITISESIIFENAIIEIPNTSGVLALTSDIDDKIDALPILNKNATLTPGGTTTIATINGKDITVGMPSISSGDGEMTADGVLSNVIADEGGNGEVIFDRTILGSISADLSHNHDALEVGSNGFYITDSYDNVVAKIDNAGIDSIDLKVNGQSVNNLINVTYSELKSLRDNGQLYPGRQYRIIDYITTTLQDDTISADHPFDIIVTADDESTLNEKARAIQREGDTYFANQKLNAWELWYCLDNDTERFAWPNNTSGELIIGTIKPASGVSASGTYIYNTPISKVIYNDIIYTPEINVKTMINSGPPIYITKTNEYTLVVEETSAGYIASGSGISVYGNVSQVGKGVIYRMIDENHNDCPYDFKNIMFRRLKDNTDFIWCYTFTYLNTNEVISSDSSLNGDYCRNNTIKEYYKNSEGLIEASLNNIVFINISGTSYCRDNSFGTNCNNNTFGDACYSNSFGTDCYSNSFGHYCYNNSFGAHCHDNTFGTYCRDNSFGNGCDNNTFGTYCTSNSFGNSCYRNSFGNDCDSNTFGNGCYGNSFGYNITNRTYFSGKVYATDGFYEE